MAELYIPKLGDVIRLTKGLILEADGNDWKQWSGLAPLGRAHGLALGGWGASSPRPAIRIELPPGTCIVFKRLFFSSQAGKSEITCAVFAHEKPELTPKMNGGTAYMDNLRFDIGPDVLNGVEYERVET